MMQNDEFVINLEGISKKYKLFETKTDRLKEALNPLKRKYHKEFYALNGLSLKVKKGEILGIVGMNGSGKSTLLKIIAGIIPPTQGEVSVSGLVVPLLELGAGFNPEFSGLENIYFYNSILGYTRKQTDAILDDILDFADIGDFIHQPLKTYSSGMKARLSFAVSVNINPDILIVDEVLSVGDELFRRKSFARIEEFFKAGKTILFVSHSAGNINQLCSRAIMLHQGRIVLEGATKFVTMNYNKFMFSNPGQRAALLEQFAGDQPAKERPAEKVIVSEPSSGFTEPNQEFRKSQHIAYQIPNFLPTSTVITAKSDVQLRHFRIETPEGEEVNALVPQDEYLFCYDVKFGEDAGHINFSMAVKTEQGFMVTWRIFPDKHRYLDREFKKGDSVVVKWKFRCLFMPGTYFINTGIRRESDEGEQLLIKAADVFAFKVLGTEITDKGGLFDPGITFSMKAGT